ncbi:MAG: Outer rane lipoproteinsorting protein [Myxococcales bacterium]|nr:Outer rane lipoproteinsorting protein [Myxococcales bacterium]
MKPLTVALAIVSLTSFSGRAAAADPTAPELLVKIDQALNAFKDAVFESKLVMKQPNGSIREYVFTTYQKFPSKRLVRFSAPGDVKGMGVLIESAETMYVFLPGFQRVRRMGTHIKNQSFMGSDFSFEDMAEIAYGTIYDAKLVGSDEKNWILELNAKAGQDLEFPKIKLWADKSMYQPTKLEYYDATGKNLKTQLRLDYAKDSPRHFQPGKVVIIDHRRNDHESQIVFTSTKIDSGLSDDIFSVRSLVRGQ